LVQGSEEKEKLNNLEAYTSTILKKKLTGTILRRGMDLAGREKKDRLINFYISRETLQHGICSAIYVLVRFRVDILSVCFYNSQVITENGSSINT